MRRLRSFRSSKSKENLTGQDLTCTSTSRGTQDSTHNVCLLVWLFTQGSGVAFANRSGTHDSLYKKLNCLLILLLMTVGCKILFAAWLPAKPYLTKLDKYLLLSFFFQTLVVLYVAFEEFWDQQAASILTKESIFWRNGYDVGAAWVYGAYLLGHICLAAMIYFDCKRGPAPCRAFR